MHGTHPLDRIFLVIPDAHDGGDAWEHFVVAPEPEEACVRLAKYLQADAVSFAFSPDGKPGDNVWTVRELPRQVTPTADGVVDWSTLQCTFWKAKH